MQTITNHNLLPAHKMLFELDPEPPRIAIIGDSQASPHKARMLGAMMRMWDRVVNWGAWPCPGHSRDPFGMGIEARDLASDPEVVATLVEAAAVYPSGLSGKITQGEQYDISATGIPDSAEIIHQEFRSTNSDFNGKWGNTEVESRIVYEFGGAGLVQGFQHQTKRGGNDFSGLKLVNGVVGGGYATIVDTISGINSGVAAHVVYSSGAEASTSFIRHAGLFIEKSAGVIVTNRPWLMEDIYLSGSKLSQWADGVLSTGAFNWDEYGDLNNALSGGDPSQWPNFLLIPLGHNDGPTQPDPAVQRAKKLLMQTRIDAQHVRYGVPVPLRYLFVQLFNTQSIDVSYWQRAWEQGWLPVSGGRISVASLAAHFKYKIHDGIDSPWNRIVGAGGGVHPNDTVAADFYYGEEGLLGILQNPDELRFPFGSVGPDVPGTGDPRTSGSVPGGTRPIIPGTGTIRPYAPLP